MRKYQENFKLLFLVNCALFVSSCMQNYLKIPQVASGTIQGTINFLSSKSPNQKTQSQSCSDPKVYLYKLDEEGNRIEPELDVVPLSSNYSYSFNLKNKNIQFVGKIHA